MELEIIVPDEVIIDIQISSMSAADKSGRFGLLPNHQKFITLLVPCVISFREESGRERYAAVDGGLLLMEKNLVSIATREAVIADRLDDVADRVELMLSARRAEERSARGEFAGLRAELLRELSIADKHKLR
jgi:F-type H+-transporting ATPase subunit epsilon